jgi:prolyl oligopeptidase
MKYFLHTTLIALLCVVISSCSNQETSVATSLDYPETTKVDHTDDYFGTIVEDPYRWLEDDMSEETGNWVKAENEVTFGYLNNIDYREKLVDRIEELLDYERISAPFEEGEYEYFYKNDGLQDHSVLFRSIIDSDDEPEVFLDPNTFSDDGTIALRGVSFTKDGTLAAYMITEGGSDWRKVIAMDAVTKTIIEDTLVNVKFSGLSWYKNE